MHFPIFSANSAISSFPYCLALLNAASKPFSENSPFLDIIGYLGFSGLKGSKKA